MSSDPCSELLLLAVRYVDDELSSDEMAAFESRLAQDQAAREALALAVELAGAFALLPATTPDVLPAPRARQRGRIRVAAGLAAAACLGVAATLGVLALRGPSRVPRRELARASVRPSEEVALAWSGLRQSGEAELVTHNELLAMLDDPATPAAAELLVSNGTEGENESDTLSPWLLEGARLGEIVKPSRSGTGEN